MEEQAVIAEFAENTFHMRLNDPDLWIGVKKRKMGDHGTAWSDGRKANNTNLPRNGII